MDVFKKAKTNPNFHIHTLSYTLLPRRMLLTSFRLGFYMSCEYQIFSLLNRYIQLVLYGNIASATLVRLSLVLTSFVLQLVFVAYPSIHPLFSAGWIQSFCLLDTMSAVPFPSLYLTSIKDCVCQVCNYIAHVRFHLHSYQPHPGTFVCLVWPCLCVVQRNPLINLMVVNEVSERM